MTAPLPLFPLKTVLFPGGALALRVFEARYVDLVARCVRGDSRFGVVAIRRGSEVGEAETFGVGTTAAIVDWHQDASGLLGIAALGHDRFRLASTQRLPDGLYMADAVPLPQPEPASLTPEHEPLAALLRKFHEAAPAQRHAAANYADAAWVGYRLAELLPLDLQEKQALLELDDACQRLAKIASAVRAKRLGA